MKPSAYQEKTQMSKTRKSKKTVELIASGYEWTCPRCGNFQCEIEAKAKVTCGTCKTEFAAESPEHAYYEG
jgi:transcription elongation factor Elf1